MTVLHSIQILHSIQGESAFLAAAALLITRRIKPQRVLQKVDWSLLVMFSGLFISDHGRGSSFPGVSPIVQAASRVWYALNDHHPDPDLWLDRLAVRLDIG